MSALAAVVCWLVLLLGSATTQQIDEYALDDLFESLQPHGGFFDARLGRACDTCARGVIAHQGYSKDETISAVPLQAGIDLRSDTSGAAARHFLAQQLLIPGFDTTHAAYLATLPRPDETFALYSFTEAHIDMLQSPALAELIRHQQKLAYQDFHDEERGMRPALQEFTNGSVSPTYDQYEYATALVTTRYFFFTDPASDELHRYLMPALDLINHSVRKANVARYQDGWKISVVALRDIQAGEELFWTYHDSLIHRADISLLLYGFVADEDLEDPVMAASDRASFTSNNCYSDTPMTDEIDQVEDASKELARAEALLQEIEAGAPLEQDKELLAALRAGERPRGTEGWTWKETEIIKFRVARKSALWSWVQRLREHVAAGRA